MKTKQYSLGEFREKLSNCLCRKRPSSKIDGNYYYAACFDCEYSSVSDTAEETINHWNLIIIEERKERKEKEEKQMKGITVYIRRDDRTNPKCYSECHLDIVCYIKRIIKGGARGDVEILQKDPFSSRISIDRISQGNAFCFDCGEKITEDMLDFCLTNKEEKI